MLNSVLESKRGGSKADGFVDWWFDWPSGALTVTQDWWWSVDISELMVVGVMRRIEDGGDLFSSCGYAFKLPRGWDGMEKMKGGVNTFFRFAEEQDKDGDQAGSVKEQDDDSDYMMDFDNMLEWLYYEDGLCVDLDDDDVPPC
ncbi:hypothetical protein L1987_54490 [Smallanthus sonchifolius]|uniref:Uncharacterized protein n=1 Tax=Smallanthus sonchifolius TaxID=185202 RepID=A0ACB9E7B9_9ASTR|nr:hypothetical protein L1987_54490 [Smallanthus sonchifolius]